MFLLLIVGSIASPDRDSMTSILIGELSTSAGVEVKVVKSPRQGTGLTV